MIDKYLDIARKLKKNKKNMMMTVIPIVVGALGTVPKGLKRIPEQQKIRGRIETLQTMALLWLTRILGRVLEP